MKADWDKYFNFLFNVLALLFIIYVGGLVMEVQDKVIEIKQILVEQEK